jgi:hypothetical protein
VSPAASILTALAELIAIIAGLGAFVAFMDRRTRPLRQLADDLRGEPERKGPGGITISPARLSVMEEQAKQNAAIAELREVVAGIHKELHPNGGSSTRDAIEAVRKSVELLLRERDRPPKAESAEAET